jgi:hypothetical protein
MFSAGQKARAQALFATGGSRVGLLSSIGCNAPSGGTTCNVPASLTSSAVGSSTATVSWAAAIGALSYSLQYKTSTATTWTTVSATSTSASLTGLTASTTYNFQVASVCSAGTSAYSTAGSFTTTAVSTCTDAYEPNESRTGAKTIPLSSNVSARISSATDKDYLKFVNTTAARNVRVSLTNLPADYDLQLFRSSTSVGISQNGGTTSESLIYNNTQAATTYTAYVYGYNGAFNATSCYTIRAEISGTSFVRQSAEELEIMNEDITEINLDYLPDSIEKIILTFDYCNIKVNLNKICNNLKCIYINELKNINNIEDIEEYTKINNIELIENYMSYETIFNEYIH